MAIRTGLRKAGKAVKKFFGFGKGGKTPAGRKEGKGGKVPAGRKGGKGGASAGGGK